VPLVAAIGASGRKPNIDILTRQYAVVEQEQFAKHVAGAVRVRFPAWAARCDGPPVLPATTARTTRGLRRGMTSVIFRERFSACCMKRGTAFTIRDAVGVLWTAAGGSGVFGIHESQSRMWENFVGRSRPFWQHFYGEAPAAIFACVSRRAAGRFLLAINVVRPSLIVWKRTRPRIICTC